MAGAAPDSHSWMGEPCSTLLRQHRSALENVIYANGVADVRRVLCSELTSLCVPRDLVDHGEL